MATIIDKTKKAVTDENTWHDFKTGLIGGVMQSFAIRFLGATFGTIASCIGVGALPTKKGPKFLRVGKLEKKFLIMNQTHDASVNLLIGEN
ncbi:MAG: hypothetical protein OQK82_02090 [Candidatus Pacearchaeota archaeon]|nr:hypothetical protein [Candidatus Pacearchaeota archaeon]